MFRLSWAPCHGVPNEFSRSMRQIPAFLVSVQAGSTFSYLIGVLYMISEDVSWFCNPWLYVCSMQPLKSHLPLFARPYGSTLISLGMARLLFLHPFFLGWAPSFDKTKARFLRTPFLQRPLSPLQRRSLRFFCFTVLTGQSSDMFHWTKSLGRDVIWEQLGIQRQHNTHVSCSSSIQYIDSRRLEMKSHWAK